MLPNFILAAMLVFATLALQLANYCVKVHPKDPPGPVVGGVQYTHSLLEVNNKLLYKLAGRLLLLEISVKAVCGNVVA